MTTRSRWLTHTSAPYPWPTVQTRSTNAPSPDANFASTATSGKWVSEPRIHGIGWRCEPVPALQLCSAENPGENQHPPVGGTKTASAAALVETILTEN